MLVRIQIPSRQSLIVLPQTCLRQQTRTYKNKLFRTPRVFEQNIVLTDGSTFKVMTTSPRKTYRLTRDKFNNPLWTGRKRSAEGDQQNMQLSRFRKSFSEGLGGEASMKELSTDRRGQDGTEIESSGDSNVDAQEALYRMLESKEAYMPTKGKDRSAGEPAKEKRKGVRT